MNDISEGYSNCDRPYGLCLFFHVDLRSVPRLNPSEQMCRWIVFTLLNKAGTLEAALQCLEAVKHTAHKI